MVLPFSIYTKWRNKSQLKLFFSFWEWLIKDFRNNEIPSGVYSNPVEAYKKRGIQITWKELLGKN